ncbi:MAG TPA: hypothetical protein VFS40_12400 [Gemmatimonadales bacterium]|nr:hypothetical protein [Gemmatimonadales bacterium]
MPMTFRALPALALLLLAACNSTDNSNVAAKLVPVTPLTLTGQLGSAVGDSIRVQVLDAGDRPVENVTVQWNANAGGTAAGTTRTSADGQTATQWVLGPKEKSQTLTASVPGLKVSSVTFTANVPSSGGGDGGL